MHMIRGHYCAHFAENHMFGKILVPELGPMGSQNFKKKSNFFFHFFFELSHSESKKNEFFFSSTVRLVILDFEVNWWSLLQLGWLRSCCVSSHPLPLRSRSVSSLLRTCYAPTPPPPPPSPPPQRLRHRGPGSVGLLGLCETAVS